MYMCVWRGGQILLTFMVVKEPLIVVRETLQHDTTVLSCQVILRERERGSTSLKVYSAQYPSTHSSLSHVDWNVTSSTPEPDTEETWNVDLTNDLVNSGIKPLPI